MFIFKTENLRHFLSILTFFTCHGKQNKDVNADKNQLDKYYCELKNLWIKISWSLFLDLALTCTDFKEFYWIFTTHLSVVLTEGWLRVPLRFRENSVLFCFGTKSFHEHWSFSCFLMKNFICFLWFSLKLSPAWEIVITSVKFYHFWKVKDIKLPLPKVKMRFLTLSFASSLKYSVALSETVFSVLNADMENWNNGHYYSYQPLNAELCLEDVSYSICNCPLKNI